MSVLKKERVIRSILRMLMRLNNLCYKNISWFALMAEGGINPKRRLMNYHQFFVDNVDPQDTVLDIGCGNRLLTCDVAQKARSVTAIDLNLDNIKFARNNFSRGNIE